MRQLSIHNKKNIDFTETETVKETKLDFVKFFQIIMIILMIAMNVIVFFMNNDLIYKLLPATLIVVILVIAKNLESNTTYNKR